MDETNEKNTYDFVLGLASLKETAQKLQTEMSRDTQDKNDYIKWLDDIDNLSKTVIDKIEEFEKEYMNRTGETNGTEKPKGC